MPSASPHGAVRTVGRDHVARRGRRAPRRSRRRAARPARRRARPSTPTTSVPSSHARPQGAGRWREQHRLEVVLRHARRRGRAEHGALLAVGIADRDARPSAASASVSHVHSEPLDVDAAGADLAPRGPRTAQQLHRPGADHGRPRAGSTARAGARPAATRRPGGPGSMARSGPRGPAPTTSTGTCAARRSPCSVRTHLSFDRTVSSTRQCCQAKCTDERRGDPEVRAAAARGDGGGDPPADPRRGLRAAARGAGAAAQRRRRSRGGAASPARPST